jgi:hypothetical protein
MIDTEKVCVECLASRSVEDFPSRGHGKTRPQCTPCFRSHANSKRRKEREHIEIAELPLVVTWLSGEESNWVEMMMQILNAQDLLPKQEADFGEEFIDLPALLKTEDRIARLVATEIRNEKDSHLSESFNRRTSEGGGRFD